MLRSARERFHVSWRSIHRDRTSKKNCRPCQIRSTTVHQGDGEGIWSRHSWRSVAIGCHLQQIRTRRRAVRRGHERVEGVGRKTRSVLISPNPRQQPHTQKKAGGHDATGVFFIAKYRKSKHAIAQINILCYIRYSAVSSPCHRRKAAWRFLYGVAMNKWVDGCGQAIGYAIIALAILSFILKNCDRW